jgi:hypothetical protein
MVFPKKGEPKYLTGKETVSLLKISVPILHEYTKRGIINGFNVELPGVFAGVTVPEFQS